jgi:hypothetical protein
MNKGYGQFCPIAKASEIVATRWTPLVLRELMHDIHSFNDIHRGVPLISRAVLVARLRDLEDQGIIAWMCGWKPTDPRNPGVADLVLSPCARRLLLSPEMGTKGAKTQRRIELRVPNAGRPKAKSDLRRKVPRPLLWV